MNGLRYQAIFTFLIIIVVSGCMSALDEDDAWEYVGDGYRWTFLGLEGKQVYSVEDTPWGLFAGTREHGVFRFDAAAYQWISLGLDHGPISELAFAATQEPMLLAAIGCCVTGQTSTPAAIYATRDAGQTWLEWDGGLSEQKDGAFFAQSLLVDEKNPYRIYAGASTYQVVLSEDGGQTWEFVSGDVDTWGGSTKTIALSPKRDGRIWFGGYNAFAYPHVYRSENWGRVAETIYWATFEGGVSKILVDEKNPAILWIAESGRIRTSEDGGDSWETVFALEQFSVAFTGLLQGPSTLFAAGGRVRPGKPHEDWELRFYESSDTTGSWQPILVPKDARHAWDLKFDRQQRLLIPTSKGVWRVEPP